MIVGLGNPGRKYAATRHNIGFMCVDQLAAQQQIAIDTNKFNGKYGEGQLAEKRVVLLKPQTYMNNSGSAVRGLADFFKIPPENLLIIYDDLDTPLGTLRIRAQGGAGGQKGMRSIIQHMGTDQIARIRFGIDRPPGRMDPAAYVLLPFIDKDLPLVRETIDRVLKALQLWLTEGIDMAMNRQNGTLEQSLSALPNRAPQPDDSQN